MEKSEILETVIPMKTETRLKAWTFQIEKKFYQVAEYGGFRVGDKTSIWETNKKGKRLSSEPVFTIISKDYNKCVNLFIDLIQQPDAISD